VATVLARYYAPFLKKFPTLSALAKAPEVEVLKSWEGLGYYQRARNLHKAAKMASPNMPNTLEGLIALPGIGQNTAHAILALAYHQPVAVLEANVKRVLARYYALPVAGWEEADALLDRKHPFIYNQAMMDIGAMICTPKAPKCPECPLVSGCKGKVNPELYPVKKLTKKVPVRERSIMVAVNAKGQIALAQKQEGRLLSGLYGFWQQEEATAGKVIGEVVQQYSHFTLKGRVILRQEKTKEQQWYTPAQIAKLPLSKLDQKVLKILIDHLHVNRQN
jgi:A/G-specific adenine glycosylase